MLLELVTQAGRHRLPRAVEATVAGLGAVLILWGMFSSRAVFRCAAWALAMMGHAALANALAPGRQVLPQLIWLGSGAALGAVLGAGLVPGRRGGRQPSPAGESGSASPLQAGQGPIDPVPLVPWPTLIAWACVACALGGMALRCYRQNVFQDRILQAVSAGQGIAICDDHAIPTLVFRWFDRLASKPIHRSLRSIDFGPSVGDEELVRLVDLGLRDLPDLNDLRLNHSRVTDAGLAMVASMERLERLTVAPAMTDGGLVQVQGLRGLKALDLSGSRITGQGLQYSANLPRLYMLTLARTAVTNDDLPRLKTLPQLSCLDLSGTQITDAGLAHLKELPNLCTLLLRQTRVSDAGVVHLKALPRLRWLYLDHTEVTEAGLKDLLHARPWIRVSHLLQQHH